MSINKIERHPFLFVFLLWAFFFVSFACFKIDRVLPVSYLAAMTFFGTFSYLFAKQKEKVRKIPKENQKALLYMLGGVLYAGIMMYTFDHVRSNPAIRSRNDMIPFLFMTGGLIFYCIYITVRKKWSVKRAILIIILTRNIMHLFAMMSGKFNLASWDMGYFFSTGDGHAGYIEYLYNNNFIPAQFDPREKWQYYHPPLHHLIEAVLLRIQTLCGVDLSTAICNIQYPNMLYTMMSVVCSYLIFKEMKLRKLPLILATAVVSFSPAFIFVGVLVNNDMLSVMFILMSILYTIRWYKNPSLVNIIKIAVSFGMGMFSKLSAALIAPPIAIIFLYVLFRALKQKKYDKFKKYFGQMWVFLLIAAPVSLYWSLRNFIRFGIPLGYVPESPDPLQHIDENNFKRIFDFNISNFYNPYLNYKYYYNDFNEYNPLVALLKSSVSDVGIMRFTFGYWPGWLGLLTGTAVAATAFLLMIYIIFAKNNIEIIYKVFFLTIYTVYILSYYSFCIKYPCLCTEQIRYAMPLIVIGALFIGLGAKELLNKKSKALVYSGYFTGISVMLFSLTSFFVFTYYGIYTTLAFMM